MPISSMVWGKKYGSDTPSHSALTSGIEGSSPRLITHEHQQSTQLRSWLKKNAPAPSGVPIGPSITAHRTEVKDRNQPLRVSLFAPTSVLSFRVSYF
jgi:hypothetical protein